MASPTSRDIVRLNVGGHLFTTTKSTLTRFPTVALDNILRNLDKEGNVFVDRDGRMFQYILGFLRNGELCLPDDFSDFDSLTTEVNLYRIYELSSCLENVKRKRIKFNKNFGNNKKGMRQNSFKREKNRLTNIRFDGNTKKRQIKTRTCRGFVIFGNNLG